VPEAIRAEADLVLAGGALPGAPSTVVDLRAFEISGASRCDDMCYLTGHDAR
jgi:L-threonylcarbamoyladenylate synthase